MFVKLTRKNGEPIWLNAETIVTIEPSRTGGAIVVPMGDGLDYDVQETPETVLALLAGETPPAATRPKKLAKTEIAKTEIAKSEADDEKPKRISRKTKLAKTEIAKNDDDSTIAKIEVSEKPKRVSRKTKIAKNEDGEKLAKSEADEKPKRVSRKTKIAKNEDGEKLAKNESAKNEPPVFFPADYLERIQRMRPGNLKKLTNTLATQFKIENPDAVVKHLISLNCISLDEFNHVKWSDEILTTHQN